MNLGGANGSIEYLETVHGTKRNGAARMNSG